MSPLPAMLIETAARTWASARDAGIDPQPRLHAVLAPSGHDMLAPAIDSLMMLGEACLGRPLCRNCALGRDADAALLCTLLADPRRLACGDRGCAAAFACALASTRRMLDLH